MTTLVTGATGRLGSRFVPRLLAEGEPVRILVRDTAKAGRLQQLGADVVIGDLRDGEVLRRAVDGMRAIVHLAASFRRVSDDEAVAVNHAATIALAHAALEDGVDRFVVTSTSLVYGPGHGRPTREDDAAAPAGAYPVAKADAERDLWQLHEGDGLGLRILRLAFVYGEGDPHLAESTFWTRDWPSHKRLHMVHHADVGQALLRALRTPGVDGETFNIADDAPVTAVELLGLNGEEVSEDASSRVLNDPWEGIVDTRNARRQLGFRPIHPSIYAAKDAGAL